MLENNQNHNQKQQPETTKNIQQYNNFLFEVIVFCVQKKFNYILKQKKFIKQ